MAMRQNVILEMNAVNNTNSLNAEVLMGGTVRVSSAPANEEPERSLGGSQINGRVTIKDGAMTTESFGITKSQGADSLSEARAAAKGILDTARTPHGTLGGKLGPNSVVVIDGMETNLATAERLGHVRRGADGNYVETGMNTAANAQGAAPVAAPVDTQDDAMVMPQEVEQVISNITEGLSQSQFEGILSKSVSFGPESLNYRQLADQLGTTEADAQARVGFVMDAYQNSANAAVKTILNGNDADDLWTWAADNAPEQHKKGMLELTMAGSTASLKALASQYMKSTNPSDEALAAAGFTTKTAPDGTKLVSINGMWMNLATAVKQGWL